MTEDEAKRILHPGTTAKAIAEIEYYAGFNRQKVIDKVSEASLVACNAIDELAEYRKLGTVEQLKNLKYELE